MFLCYHGGLFFGMAIFPIRYGFIGFLLGVFIAGTSWWWLLIFPFGVCIYFTSRQNFLWQKKTCFFLFGILFGIFRFLTYDFPCSFSDETSSSSQIFSGIVVEFPDVRNDSIFYTVKITGTKTKIKLMLPLYPGYHYGDLLQWRGEWERIDHSPDLCAIFWRPNIQLIAHDQGSIFLSVLFQGREGASEILEKIFPEPHASFAKGLLLGDRGGLGPELMEHFRKSGLIHLVALSGYNIALVVIFFALIFQSFLPKWHFSLTSLGIAAFVLLVGASASVTRAAVMGFLWLTGRKIGRPHASFHALFCAAFFMVLWNPRILLYDVGFQLSAAATFGLILFARFGNSSVSKLPEIFGWRDVFASTLVAQFATFPIIFLHFGTFSFWGLFSNLFVVPLMPIVMIALFFVLVAGSLWLPFGIFLSFFPALLLSWILKVAQWFG